VEFLKGFTQDTVASLNERRVIHISTGAALPVRPEGGPPRCQFVIFVKKKSKKHNKRVGASSGD